MKRKYIWIAMGVALIALAIAVGMLLTSQAGTLVRRTQQGGNPNVLSAYPPSGGYNCWRPVYSNNTWEIFARNVTVAQCQGMSGWGQACPIAKTNGSPACFYNLDLEWFPGDCFLDNGTNAPETIYPKCANAHGAPPVFKKFCYDQAQTTCDFNPD